MPRLKSKTRNEELRKQIGSYIKEWRMGRNITQAQLAEMVDISEKHMSQIEQGVSFPSISVLIELAVVLETSVESLLFGGNQRKDETWNYIDTVYASLGEATRRSLRNVVRELYELEKRLKDGK